MWSGDGLTSLAGRTWSQYLIESGVVNGESGRVSASGRPNTTGYRGRGAPTPRVLHRDEQHQRRRKDVEAGQNRYDWSRTGLLLTASSTMSLKNGCAVEDTVCCSVLGFAATLERDAGPNRYDGTVDGLRCFLKKRAVSQSDQSCAVTVLVIVASR